MNYKSIEIVYYLHFLGVNHDLRFVVLPIFNLVHKILITIFISLKSGLK